MIERRTERDQAVPRDAAVGRLQADHAAHRGRLANRSAGVGPERQRRDARRDGGRRSAARAAGNAIERPRVVHGTERRVLVRRAHRELVAVGLADDDRARRVEPRETTVASYGGDVGLEHARRGGGADPSRAQVVLERDRHADQRAIAPSVEIAIDLGRALERLFARHGVERVQRRVDRLEPVERLAADVAGRTNAPAHGVPNLADGFG